MSLQHIGLVFELAVSIERIFSNGKRSPIKAAGNSLVYVGYATLQRNFGEFFIVRFE